MKTSLLVLCFTWLVVGRLPASPAFTLASQTFAGGGTIPQAQLSPQAGGSNISPELRWNGAPKSVKSFALTVFDPDAHGGWWHWVLVNIPPKVHVLPAGAADRYQNGRNSSGDNSYDGPCPPIGDPPHHYIFTLYALSIRQISINPNQSPADISNEVKENAIASAVLIGRYGR